MAGFVFGCILALLGLIAIGVGVVNHYAYKKADRTGTRRGGYSKDPGFYNRVTRNIAAGCAPVLLILGGAIILASMYVGVGAQNVGIVISQGRPTGEVFTPGGHLKAPWEGVVTLYDGVQTTIFEGKCAGSTDGIPTRIAQQQTACAQVRMRWQMIPKAASTLYRQYRTTGNIRISLVDGELGQAMNQQFQAYNPIASLTTTAAEGSPGNPTTAQLAARVQQQMNGEIGTQIAVKSVIVRNLVYASSVQDRINSVLAQVAQTDIAQQAEKTAQAQAAANRALAASVSHDPGVLVSRCEDLVGEAIKAGYALPTGFNCTSPSNVGIVATK